MQRFKIFLIVATVLVMSGVNLALPQTALAWTPMLTSAAFIDFDHNGTIDRLKVTFDLNVTSCQFEAGDWAVSPGTIGLTSPTGRLNGSGSDANCDGSTNYFYLLVSGDANETGYPGTYVPADIYYKNQGTLGSVMVSGVAVPTQSMVNVDDNATPVMRSDGTNAPTYSDIDHNGTIDQLRLIFTEPVNFTFNSSDWAWAAGSLTGFNPVGYSSGSGSSAIFLNATANANITGVGAGTAPTIRYAALGIGVQDKVGNSMAGMASAVNISDGAPPVIVSTVPTAGATGVSVTTSYVRIIFSEPMETSTVSVSISSGSWGPPSWSGNTITRYRWTTLSYDTNITVTTTGEDMVGYLLSSGASPAVTNPWSFRTTTDPALTVSASQSTVSASPTSVVADGSSISVITATIKNSSGSPLSGKTVTLSSNRGSTDTIVTMTGTTGADGKAYFQVRSNTAGSPIFTAIASGTVITQTATVTFTSATPTPGPVSASRSSVYATPSSVTADGSSYATVSVTVRDASDNLLSGKTVVLTSNRGSADTVSSAPGGSITNSSGQATLQVRSGTAGTAIFSATVDGTTITQTATVTFTATTPLPGLIYGDLFKESGSTAVYYYGTDGKRHVFPTQAIYFSWYSGFSGIKTVSHGTVTSVPLGGNVIAKPGTYLVQFVSMDTPFRVLDPKIYALEASGQLRWVTSASAASALYGADWEKKIIAAPEVFRTNYIEGGANINSVADYSKASVEASARTISDTIR